MISRATHSRCGRSVISLHVLVYIVLKQCDVISAYNPPDPSLGYHMGIGQYVGNSTDKKQMASNINKRYHNPRVIVSRIKGGSLRVSRASRRRYVSRTILQSSSAAVATLTGQQRRSAVDRFSDEPRGRYTNPHIATILDPSPIPASLAETESKRQEEKVATLSTNFMDKQAQRKAASDLKSSASDAPLTKIDLSLPVVYFCNALAITFPVILVPLIGEAYTTSPSAVSSFVAKVSSIGIMGGGIGKIINGIVCQLFDAKITGLICLLGVSMCCLALSMTRVLSTINVGRTLAGLEFFASGMWIVCSLILANHYKSKPLLFVSTCTKLKLCEFSKRTLFLNDMLMLGLFEYCGLSSLLIICYIGSWSDVSKSIIHHRTTWCEVSGLQSCLVYELAINCKDWCICSDHWCLRLVLCCPK